MLSKDEIPDVLDAALDGPRGGCGSHWEGCRMVHRDCAAYALANQARLAAGLNDHCIRYEQEMEQMEAERDRLQAENRRLLEALQGLKDSVTGFLLPALNKTLEALPIGHPAKQGWFVDKIQFHKATAETDAILLRED